MSGELMGYWEAKEKLGNPEISWSDLVQPTIELCKNGVPISSALASAIQRSEKLIRKDPGLKEIFVNPDTDKVCNGGSLLIVCAKTLNISLVLISGQGCFRIFYDKLWMYFFWPNVNTS